MRDQAIDKTERQCLGGAERDATDRQKGPQSPVALLQKMRRADIWVQTDLNFRHGKGCAVAAQLQVGTGKQAPTAAEGNAFGKDHYWLRALFDKQINGVFPLEILSRQLALGIVRGLIDQRQG